MEKGQQEGYFAWEVLKDSLHLNVPHLKDADKYQNNTLFRMLEALGYNLVFSEVVIRLLHLDSEDPNAESPMKVVI